LKHEKEDRDMISFLVTTRRITLKHRTFNKKTAEYAVITVMESCV